MEIMTRDFGEIEINKEDIIEFPQALPGFPEQTDFVLLPLKEESPFIIMQSVQEPQLAFITIDPGEIVKDYEFDIGENVEKLLKIEKREQVGVLNIVTIKNSMEDMTVNLAAPLVINFEKNLAKQVILNNDKYPVRYKVFDKESQKEKVAE
ncbi:MAG: flagellar assembly protein FliW [bacterium]